MVRRRKLHHFVDKKRVHEAILAAEESCFDLRFDGTGRGSVQRTAQAVLRKHARRARREKGTPFFSSSSHLASVRNRR